jgi:2-aminoadipate transaminase
MRLNFSGVGEDQIREGIRRIGEVLREQVGLYETLTGARPATRSPVSGDSALAAREVDDPGVNQPRPDPELAKVLRLPANRKRAG